eukprot:3397471-Amphidinium_carterae.1
MNKFVFQGFPFPGFLEIFDFISAGWDFGFWGRVCLSVTPISESLGAEFGFREVNTFHRAPCNTIMS